VPQHTFILNGKQVSVDCADDVRLLWVLNDLLGVYGPKYGCGLGVCQACTSHINGKAFNPCCVRVGDIKSRDKITTIEGLAATVGKPLHPVQQAWLDYDVSQCGYCQAGQIMSATALLKRTPKPTDAQIDEAMSANICRCGTYVRVRNAIKQVAASQSGAAR
jgi:isoquinoline 1-oxidoreductase alpha subunit